LPITMKLDPSSMSSAGGSGNGAPSSPKKQAFKTVPMLTKENDALKEHISYLESLLKQSKIGFKALD
jgi:hypothetical protein